jgi:hypothetical protein
LNDACANIGAAAQLSQDNDHFLDRRTPAAAAVED